MAKRWTVDDDMFLARYEDMIPDWHNFIASHDLGFKGKDAGFKRYMLLKETGVWEKLQQLIAAQKTLYGWHTLAFSKSDEARQIAFDELEYHGLPIPEWSKANQPDMN